MPDFKSTDVDSKRIETVSGSIDDDIKELLSIRSEIQSGIISQLDPYWQGQAKQSFDNRLALYATGFSKLVDGYKELNEQLKKAGVTYSKADDAAKQLVAKLPK